MLIISANTPAAVTPAPARTLNHHRIFFITFRSQQDDIVTAFQTVERVVAPTSCKPTEAFPSSSLATKRQCLCSFSNTWRRASKSASRLGTRFQKSSKEPSKKSFGTKRFFSTSSCSMRYPASRARITNLRITSFPLRSMRGSGSSNVPPAPF